MKRILKISVLAGAAAIMAGLAAPSRSAAQPGPGVDHPSGRLYGVYGAYGYKHHGY